MNITDKAWNPWHGCHKCSEGCQNCYAYFLDKRYGRDTNQVMKNKSNFNFPVKKNHDGSYKLQSGEFVRVCMTSDFFLEEADEWRGENYLGSRPLHYEWVKKIHDQCAKHDVQLIFGQTGNIFVRDGVEHRIFNRTRRWRRR